MSIFDCIKYPISDTIQISEICALPMAILAAIQEEMFRTEIFNGPKLPQLMRRVILEWEEPNDNL